MAQQVDLGLGYKDWTRVVWTGVQAAIGYAAAAAMDWVPGQTWSWKTVLVGALAAGASAIKNFVLADTSGLK